MAPAKPPRSVSGEARPTSGTASIANVARRAGVSIATVSRVVNGVANKASPATIARVREAVAALDYRPSSAGKSLRQKSSRLVAVLAANLANPTMAAIAASAEIALREAGLVMVLCDTHDRADLQDEYLREMRAQQACAIVMLAVVESPMLDQVRTGPTPLVFVNRRAPSTPDAPFIGIDNRAAGTELARHCIARGLTRIAVIHARLSSSATRDRVEAITAAFAEVGRPIPPEHLVNPPGPDHLVIGFEGAKAVHVRASGCQAIICSSDLIAFGARRYWRDHAPESTEPVLLGFDDSPLNDWVAPWLTSIRIPYDAFGAAIVDLLREASSVDLPKERILPHRLVVRSG